MSGSFRALGYREQAAAGGGLRPRQLNVVIVQSLIRQVLLRHLVMCWTVLKYEPYNEKDEGHLYSEFAFEERLDLVW